MEENKKKFNHLKILFKKDIHHVFFIINPVLEIIIFLWIKLFNIPSANIILLRLRKNSSGILNFESTYFKKTFLDRLFLKIGFDTNSDKYSNFIKSKSVKFYLYSSWVHPEFYALLKNKNCLGHFYLEEGQLSQRKINFIKNDKIHIDTIRNDIKFAEELKSLHRSDAIYYISIDPKAFPNIHSQKKILLEDFSPIMNTYKPSLIGKKFIGIGPAPRRLYNKNLINSLIILTKAMPDGSMIKLHPGFELRKNELNLLKKQIKEKTNKEINFCNQGTLLEIEMIFEKKCFFGAKSSLIRYAELFGSEYQILDLYN